MDHPPIHLAFDGGTLVVTGPDPERLAALPLLPLRPAHQRLPRRGQPLPRPRRAPAPRADPLQGRGPRLPADAVAAAHQPRPVPAPDRGAGNVVERRRPRRRRAADRHRQDLRRHPRHQQDRPARPGRHADHRPAQPVVRRTARRLRRAGRPARRRLLRPPAAHRHHLRLGLHPPGALGQPLRPARLRRVPSPAGAVVHGGGRRQPRPVPPRPDRHAGTHRRPGRRCWTG